VRVGPVGLVVAHADDEDVVLDRVRGRRAASLPCRRSRSRART
jgi:hypothetical protein